MGVSSDFQGRFEQTLKEIARILDKCRIDETKSNIEPRPQSWVRLKNRNVKKQK